MKFQYISMPYGHILFPLCFPLGFLQLVDIREPVATYSYKRPFQLVYFFLLLLLLIF